MFLGYAEDTKKYRVYDLEKDKISVSRSVKLDKREVGGIYETHSPKQVKLIHVTKNNDDSAVSGPTKPEQDQDKPMECEEEKEIPDAPMNEEEFDINGRTRKPMLLLENGSVTEESLEGSEGPPSPKRARIDGDGLIAEAVLAYAVSVGEESDLPTTYAQAMASDEAKKWRPAMDAELNSHRQNRTWTLVPRVDKYGVDFFETYSPVANMYSIRVVLAVYAVLDYKMEQLEVDTTFFNSVLSDCVYMEDPIGD
ncbi:FOG: Transposon-encoded proteins with TYA, reverse transcriptase, integrase domains in various combinations [Plasmopara halstedii]|uniref:FOG: Transposon-encoded proteins with TYA, reverse transcriptase, integrase domains in various combinations n=1 Tax=Plasmopara halstedii TaxID=4781 RepID=A0A0N7L697_PLAHL|nr:FOG: Transposon-encoded proteins with TYA, reverse transcriptase, integrase domains in various combinations [Plasmopara halstedii]CEG43667.1 FOG: Transposon-encoded proteins with TYA, reverse transcriptase, integrase domains in various combinations [Plasmopara halstedii]|eukprot:XP_024580036.1 FOG: Transposon-encoded proteins with TYA, reverse transcriptase, integrase domains in various combinations [Plasmopara halstedii]